MTIRAAKHPPLDASGVALACENAGGYVAIRARDAPSLAFVKLLHERGLLEWGTLRPSGDRVSLISNARSEKFFRVVSQAGGEIRW